MKSVRYYNKENGTFCKEIKLGDRIRVSRAIEEAITRNKNSYYPYFQIMENGEGVTEVLSITEAIRFFN